MVGSAQNYEKSGGVPVRGLTGVTKAHAGTGMCQDCLCVLVACSQLNDTGQTAGFVVGARIVRQAA